MLAAIALRPLFLNAPTRDFFQWEGVEECVALVRPLYDDAGDDDSMVVHHPVSECDFPPEIREQAYVWLRKYL